MRRLAAPLAVAALPVVVATGRAVSGDWIPMGDNAYFAVRARDVLTEHHPLVGAWSSGSVAVGVEVNNLGPLQLDLLALPVRLLGFGTGTAVGVGAINLAAVAMVVVLAHRRLGSLGAWLGAALATALSWTLGSALLFEPRQHHAMVLPFLAVLVGAWAVAAGERWAVVPTVAAASLVTQTHLTFIAPTALVVAAAAITAWAFHRREAWRRPLLVGLGVAAICWAQPVAEELGSGQGNLSAVNEAARADRPSFGAWRAVRATAEVLGPPHGWWRPSFRAFDPAAGMSSTAIAMTVLILLGSVVTALLAAARRRGDAAVVAWLVLAAVAAVAGTIGSATSPVSPPFGAVSGNFRYLWPISAFLTFGVVAGVVRGLPARFATRAPAVLAAATVGMTVAALPTSYQSPAPESDAPLVPAARALYDQVRASEVPAPVLVDQGLAFGQPYTYVVVAALQADGVDLVFDTPTDRARFGDERGRSGPVASQVTFAVGDRALRDQPGRVLLARASLLDGEARTELARLESARGLSPSQARHRDELRDRADRGTVAVWLSPGDPE